MAFAQRSWGGSNSVALPAKIKCNGCRQVKNTASFSNKQQNDLAAHIKSTRGFNAITTPVVSCIGCTPRQVVELHCSQCDLDKGLDKFAKTQRKDPDNAVCFMCSEERINWEPGAQDGDQSPASGSGGEGSEDGSSDDDDFTITTPTVASSASGTVRGTYSSRSTGGVPLSNAGSTVGVSTASTANNSKTPGSRTVASSSATKTSGGGKFAKVRAVPRKIVYAKAEEERRQEKNDSDSDRFVLSDSE